MKLSCTQINSAAAKVVKAEDALVETIASEQQLCNHQRLADVDEMPPYRICLHCGITEKGWGPGYIALKYDDSDISLPSISYNKYLQLRQGLMINDDQKTKLLRRETTLKELIREWRIKNLST